MMARYYYAYHWTYGIGTTWEDGSWPGSLMVFDSMGERDKWVADDVFDGDWHREAITAKEARRIMADNDQMDDVFYTEATEEGEC